MYIGIDIGGTNTRIAGSVSAEKIEPIGEITIPTRDTFEEGIPEIIEQIKNITKVPKGIGIGLPGSITKDGQDFDDSTNLQCWVHKPIIDILHKEFGCSVYIENDAVAQAHGEAFFRPRENFIYLVWGTGIGGSLIFYEGTNIKSEKLDRFYLDKWEKEYGGKQLETRFAKSAEKIGDNEWSEVMEDFKNSLLELSTQLSTNTIIIAGGVLHHQKERILKIINNLLTPRVFISKLGDSVGVYGAISLIRVKEKAKI